MLYSPTPGTLLGLLMAGLGLGRLRSAAGAVGCALRFDFPQDPAVGFTGSSQAVLMYALRPDVPRSPPMQGPALDRLLQQVPVHVVAICMLVGARGLN